MGDIQTNTLGICLKGTPLLLYLESLSSLVYLMESWRQWVPKGCFRAAGFFSMIELLIWVDTFHTAVFFVQPSLSQQCFIFRMFKLKCTIKKKNLWTRFILGVTHAISTLELEKRLFFKTTRTDEKQYLNRRNEDRFWSNISICLCSIRLWVTCRHNQYVSSHVNKHS